MRAWRGGSLLGVLAMALVGAVMAGCAVVDQYSGRALGYNVEAEQASQQAILLNIVRASQKRPMQFTTVSSINGTASSSGTFGFSAPLGAGGASYKTGTLGGSFSGGPTFTVPVLDTAEFYNGIMNPIPGVLFDLYIQAGYARDLLFNLFIDKIVVHNKNCDERIHNADCEFSFVNHAYSPVALDLYQAFTGYLIGLGLTTQRIAKPDAAKSGDTGAGGQPPAKVKSGQGTDSPPPPPPDYAFCFAPSDPSLDSKMLVPPESRCESPAEVYAPSASKKLDQAQKKVTELTQQQKDTAQVLVAVKAANLPQLPSNVDALPTQLRSLPKSQMDVLKKALKGSSDTQAVVTALEKQQADRKKQIATAESKKKTAKLEAANSAAAQAKMQSKKIGATSVQDVVLTRELIHYLIAIAKKTSADGTGSDTDPHTLCKVGAPSYVLVQGEKQLNVCGALEQLIRDGKGEENKTVTVEMSVYIRSTENLIYYLGELVSNQNRRVVQARPYLVYTHFDGRVCDAQIGEQDGLIGKQAQECKRILVVEEGVPAIGNSAISVIYGGAQYSIPAENAGYSMQVLEIVKQLLAMSSSAKSLPQTNVISVISQ